MSPADRNRQSPDRPYEEPESRHRRLRRTLEQLTEDARTLQHAATVLDDAVGDMRFDTSTRTLPTSVAKIQSGAVALALSLLAIVARAERTLMLTGLHGCVDPDEDAAPDSRGPGLDSAKPRTMREVIESLQHDNAEAVLELRELDDAMGEVLANLEMLDGTLHGLHSDIAALLLEQTVTGRLEAMTEIEDSSGRASESSERIVAAFRQLRYALKTWAPPRSNLA